MAGRGRVRATVAPSPTGTGKQTAGAQLPLILDRNDVVCSDMICFHVVHGAGHMARARGPGPGEEMSMLRGITRRSAASRSCLGRPRRALVPAVVGCAALLFIAGC